MSWRWRDYSCIRNCKWNQRLGQICLFRPYLIWLGLVCFSSCGVLCPVRWWCMFCDKQQGVKSYVYSLIMSFLRAVNFFLSFSHKMQFSQTRFKKCWKLTLSLRLAFFRGARAAIQQLERKATDRTNQDFFRLKRFMTHHLNTSLNIFAHFSNHNTKLS